MAENQVVEKLIQLIGEGTSPYHVTAGIERQFQKAGYERLFLPQPWKLEEGGAYYTMIQGSALIAFSVGERIQADHFRIAAAHTDFPGLRLKQRPELVRNGYAQLNAEVYGGAILHTWLDRPLSVSGRVSLRSEDMFHPVTRLVDFEKPMFVIPNLAIHLNREVNKGTELNRQKEMLPLAGISGAKMGGQYFRKLLAERLEVEEEAILDYELGLYNRDQPEYVGFDERNPLDRKSGRRPGSITCPACRPSYPGWCMAEETASTWRHFLTMKRSGAERSRGPVPRSCPWCWRRLCMVWERGAWSIWKVCRKACSCRWMWDMRIIPIIRRKWILRIKVL